MERTRAPRPSLQAARLPLQYLPRGEGAGGAPGAALQTCSCCAPRGSPARVAAAAAAVAASRAIRGGERSSPPLPHPSLVPARSLTAPRTSPPDMDFLLALVLGSSLYLPAVAEFDGR